MRPRLPRRLLLELTVSLLRRERRSALDDARRMLRGLPREPAASGVERVPAAGGLVIIANHYQRWDLWIGWEGALLMHALGRPIHWLVLRELRLGSYELPLTRRVFGRVAATYALITVPADAAEPAIAAVREAVRWLDAGEVVGLFPEGPQGHAGGLSAALPRAAKFACLLSRHAPIVPAAVHETDGRLCASFGPPVAMRNCGPEQLMQPIRALLAAGS